MLKRVFEPLGYTVSFEGFISDENFPGWGDSKYVNLTIKGNVTLSGLLHHIYVLIPVFDRQKHYWIGKEEVDKLLRRSERWLTDPPEKAFITGRYLNRKSSFVNMAFERLKSAEELAESEEDDTGIVEESGPNLNKQRLGSVVAAVKPTMQKNVVDIGWGKIICLTY